MKKRHMDETENRTRTKCRFRGSACTVFSGKGRDETCDQYCYPSRWDVGLTHAAFCPVPPCWRWGGGGGAIRLTDRRPRRAALPDGRSANALLTDGGGDAPHAPWPGDVPGYSRRLSCSRRLGRGGLLVHLPVALPEVKHLCEGRSSHQHRHHPARLLSPRPPPLPPPPSTFLSSAISCALSPTHCMDL